MPFEHPCHCGKLGGWGYNGTWTCFEHRPEGVFYDQQKSARTEGNEAARDARAGGEGSRNPTPGVRRQTENQIGEQGRSRASKRFVAAGQVMEQYAIVTLEWYEIEQAGYVALQRTLYALKNNVKEKYGAAKSDLGGINRHFVGCLGEKSLAKHTDRFWSGTVGRIDLPDVHIWQVRACTRINKRMMLHPDDKDDDIFVLVHVIAAALPRVRLSGWLHARDGKRDEFWSDPSGQDRPAFFVPNNQLRPMGEFDANAIQEGDFGS